MPDSAPLVHTLRVQVDPVAAGSSFSSVLGEAPFAGTVQRVSFIPSATVTGANTNSRTFSVVNRGQAGAGAATVASLAMTSGVNAASNDARDLTLSGTPANVTVASGDVLTFESTTVGTGIADPGGLALVEIARA